MADRMPIVWRIHCFHEGDRLHAVHNGYDKKKQLRIIWSAWNGSHFTKSQMKRVMKQEKDMKPFSERVVVRCEP